MGKSYFLNEIPFSKNDLVIDCGANVGDLKIFFVESNILINYIGIEPSPEEFRCLKKNVFPSQAKNIGLWHKNGFLNFFVSSHNADSSFIAPSSYTHIKKIPVKRLDSIFNEGQNIKLFKVEAEGAEPEVILGASNLLPHIEYICADLGFERGSLKESTLAPVVNYLLANNFELVKVNYPRIVALFRNKKLKKWSANRH